MASPQKAYALFNVTLIVDGVRLQQGSIVHNPNSTGEDLIQISNEVQGSPIVSKVDPATIIHMFTINPTQGSDTYRFLKKYEINNIYNYSLDFEVPLYFDDGIEKIVTQTAFILPPDTTTYEKLAGQYEWRIFAYNVNPEFIGG